jgi:hypothetical protein
MVTSQVRSERIAVSPDSLSNSITDNSPPSTACCSKPGTLPSTRSSNRGIRPRPLARISTISFPSAACRSSSVCVSVISDAGRAGGFVPLASIGTAGVSTGSMA